MSGIVGIVNLDGAPVESELLQRLTEFMTYRGPDAQTIWLDGCVGFGHTMLQTTFESQYEHQPYTLDDLVWITADARIDGRKELIEKLGIREQLQLNKVTDVELILRAYLAWGEDCVQHLLGDFAFFIWDGRQQRLFCARDQFGVKLFYYAQVGNCLICSNTLNCIRLHPRVSNQLNEQAIGDFLLFEMNYNLETTTFADIQRLPAAQTLTVSDKVVKRQRYWSLSIPEQIRYKRDEDYIEQFQEVMGIAVGDRLRLEKVAVLMSGGLDSTTIAQTALDVAAQQSQPLDLQAFTTVYDNLIPDTERYYSGLAAEALRIPIHYLVCDRYKLYEGSDRPELRSPEPYHQPLSIAAFEHSQQVVNHSRVALYGQGGDEALKTSTVVEMLKGMATVDVVADVVRCLLIHHLRPPLGSGIKARLQWRGRKPTFSTYPRWLNPSFANRLNLPARWDGIRNVKSDLTNPPRSMAYRGLLLPLWSEVFESCDPGIAGVPVEVRLPFLDLRLLSYLLGIPPLPWCVSKQLLRVAMRNRLPDAVRQRPKTPLAGLPYYKHICQGQNPWKHLEAMPEIADYVDINVLLQATDCQLDISTAWDSLRPVSLGYWLQQQRC